VFSYVSGRVDMTKDRVTKEWGDMLAYYDAQVEWFRGVTIETKERSIRRDDVNLRHAAFAKDMAEYQSDNPNLPSIPYNAVLYKAQCDALCLIQDPPTELRARLLKLSKGKELLRDEWPSFVEIYAQFIAAVEVLYAYDPDVDEMQNQRVNWNKHNKERWLRYAAQRFDSIMREHTGIGIEQARNVFVWEVNEAVNSGQIPDGWTISEYSEFLGKPDKNNDPRLRKAYGQSLTLNRIAELLKG
jgi:hypothetical protein